MKGRFPHKIHSTRRSERIEEPPTEHQRIADLCVQHGMASPLVSDARRWVSQIRAAEHRPGVVSICGVEPSPLEWLPTGYGYKGGAARYLLSRVLRLGGLRLGSADELPPRDIDLVRIGSGWTTTDRELSERWMPFDFARGHGVEVIESWERYANSRDLSINEILWIGGELRMTEACFVDSVACVLRPCRYRAGTLHRPPALAGTLAAKLVRMQVEYGAFGSDWRIVGIPEDQTVTEFEIAVQVNKILARGEDHAERFLEHLYERGWLTVTSFGSKSLLMEFISAQMPILPGGIQFFYHASPDLQSRLNVE